MNIKMLFKGDKSLDEGKIITLEQARRYERDERYKDYIFPVEETENGELMCRPQLTQNLESISNVDRKAEKRNRRNAALNNIYAGGKYRGIDQNVNRGTRPQYNNWQNAKRYHPKEYQK